MLIAAIGWVGCAVVLITAAIRTTHHPGAAVLGRWTTATLFIVAGAAVNAAFLLRGDDYAEFADGSAIAFVRHTWRTLVVPNHHWWIGLLIVFEVAVGTLVLLGGARTQAGYVLAIAFHAALLSFGWAFAVWSVPMIAALSTLLRAERRAPTPAISEDVPSSVAERSSAFTGRVRGEIA